MWTIGTLEGLLSVHDSWPQGPCPRVGLEVKTYDTLKKCFSTFLLWKQLMQIVGQTWLNLVTPYFGIMSQYDLMFDLKIFVGHCDLHFMVQWFCLIAWRLFDIWTPYFGVMSQYDLMIDLKICVGHCDLYFMVQWFCLVSWTLFSGWTSYFQSMNQYGPPFDLKNVGHCDLYFMDQWLCLIAWRLFHVWTSFFGIMNQYDPTHDLRINVGHCV